MNLRGVIEARDGTEEEIELLVEQQPSVFKSQIDPITRRHIEARARRAAARKRENVGN